VLRLTVGAKILMENESAARLLQRADALTRNGEQLLFTHALTQEALLTELRRLAQREIRSCALRLPRSNRKTEYVAQLSTQNQWDNSFCLRIVDPECDLEAVAQYVTRLYRLTPSESLVCKHLLQGVDAVDIAAATGLKATTIRTYLVKLFRKTGTNGQLTLIRQLMLVGAMLNLSEPDYR
jgi:DNA-binding NarL/FixJ family response regulator